jgi:hypothetical protein
MKVSTTRATTTSQSKLEQKTLFRALCKYAIALPLRGGETRLMLDAPEAEADSRLS